MEIIIVFKERTMINDDQQPNKQTNTKSLLTHKIKKCNESMNDWTDMKQLIGLRQIVSVCLIMTDNIVMIFCGDYKFNSM